MFEADEAVAIAQELLRTLRAQLDAGETGGDPPSSDNVFLTANGSVSCYACKTPPTVADMGIFLHTLLPAGSPHVPDGLRHTVACAVASVHVDVLAFDALDALDAFSRELARYENGVRAALIRGVLARSGGTLILRPAASITVPRTASVARRRVRAMTPAAAALAAGLAFMASGEWSAGRAPLAASRTVPVVAYVATPGRPRVNVRRIVAAHPRRPAATMAAMTAAPQIDSRPDSRPSSRGVLARLHLGWLRTRIIIRNDL